MGKVLELPECYESLRPRIEKTLRPFIRITAEKGSTGRFDCKFGGDPYFPLDAEYPCDEAGHPMKLLAQINFEQIPTLPLFPTSGILQFYLSVKDDSYGFDYGKGYEQKNFRALFFEKPIKDEDKLKKDFEFAKLSEEDEFPIFSGCEAKLTFTKDEEYMSIGDFRLEKDCGIKGNEWKPELEDFYNKCYDAALGHKIAGYPGFAQNDPRGELEQLSGFTHLLLQIDSDDKIDCEWGDGGVGNFFITEEDLKKKDFSKVLYNYDCC